MIIIIISLLEHYERTSFFKIIHIIADYSFSLLWVVELQNMLGPIPLIIEVQASFGFIPIETGILTTALRAGQNTLNHSSKLLFPAAFIIHPKQYKIYFENNCANACSSRIRTRALILCGNYLAAQTSENRYISICIIFRIEEKTNF